MSFIKSFILGIILALSFAATANASLQVKKVTKADAKAYAKIEKHILEAESKTGVSADLIAMVAFAETNFGHNTRNPHNPKVNGVMQQSRARWSEDVKKHARKLGLSAKSSVHNERANILIGAAGLAENRKYLERKVRGKITDGDVYMSWFIGLYGGERILKAQPGTPISKYISITRGNRSLLTQNGRVLTVSEFRNRMQWFVHANKKQVQHLVNRSKFDVMIASLQHVESDYQTAMLPSSRGYQ